MSKMIGRFSPAVRTIIKESADKIFGNRPVVPYRTGFKVLLQKPTGPTAVNYYMKDSVKAFKKASPEFATDLEDRRKDALIRMKRKGKGPPKKGQGKRATKAAAKKK